MSNPTKQDAIKLLDVFDPEMATLLHREEKRQFETIGLIASENHDQVKPHYEFCQLCKHS